MKIKQIWFPLFAVSAFAAFAFSPPAFSKPTVYFAGFALRGSAATTQARFPFTSHLLHQHNANGIDRIDAAIRSKLSGQRSKHFALNLNGLGNIADNQSITAAFTLNRESIGEGKIGATYKLYIQLSGDVLFFDYKHMTVIASYPVSMEYVDAFSHQPTHADIASDVKALYLGHLKLNLINDYIQTLLAAHVKRKYGNHLRVTAVHLSPSALSKMAPAFRNDTSDAREFIAETFGQSLSSNDHVALLPYVKDQAIGNKMALRFANGKVFSLSIPETDYALKISVDKFKRFPYQKRAYATTWIYAAYIQVELLEPLSKHIYLRSKFRDGVVKLIPSNQSEVTNWPVYQEALLKLFKNVTTSFIQPNSSWAEKASNAKDIHQQLASTRKVLQSCR